MAKEFKRGNGPSPKGKKTFGAKKGKTTRAATPSFARKKKDSPADDYESAEGRFNEKKSADPKKSRSSKDNNKPSFERYRDNARPSDFGSGRKRPAPDYNENRPSADERPSRRPTNTDEGSSSKRKSGESEERSSFKRKTGEPTSFRKKSFSDTGDEKPAFKRRAEGDDEKPAFKKRTGESSSFRKKPFSDAGGERPAFKRRGEEGDEKPAFKKRTGESSFKKNSFSDKPAQLKKTKTVNPYDLDESDLEYGKESTTKGKGQAYTKKPYGKKTFTTKRKGDSNPQREKDDGLIRLNKYISNAGICSRREADDLIESGVVQVNGKTITEMGYRVKPTDIIKYGGQTLKKERFVYLVLNKPKDYITTVDDPQKRRTVLELVQGACKERIYPVGRLDRSTTGLLMFTNDGELTKKLTHPRYGIRKIYHVELDKPLKRQDLDMIAEGIELEDGQIKVDEVTYVGDGKDKTQIGIEIHSGKNRIVRRIFEHLGYNVRKLDRVMFGSLTKKDLSKGRWRFLTDAEVGMLKMISSE
jgi:23S rRNA pseudouridine2605 synthase